MDPHRSAWIGSTEFTYHTWTPASSLHCPPKSNFPQDLPTLIAFRTYTRATEGSARIGQLNARPNAQDLDEEEEYDLARQEYFYSQQQLTDEASNIVFVTASSGDLRVVIRLQDLPSFIVQHADCIFICLNAAVDFMLIKTHLEGMKDDVEAEEALNAWKLITDECRLRDVYILDGLVRLGLEDGRTLARTLEEITAEYCPELLEGNRYASGRVDSPSLPTSNSQFGSSSGLSAFLGANAMVGGGGITGLCPRRVSPSVGALYALTTVEPHEDTMVASCIVDVIVLHECYSILLLIALRVAFEQRTEMFASAPTLYGPLSEGVQVKGSIVLYDMTKNGIAIDRALAKKVQVKLESRLSNAVDLLMADEKSRSIFQISVDGDGKLFATREGAKPKIDLARLEELLVEITADITSQYNVDMVIPRIAGGGLSRAPRSWAEYSNYSDFLKTWIEMEQAAHFNAFLSHLTEDRAHPQYTIMVRNGRTSAMNPPIQQTPRKGGFREMFCARPGHVLVAIDYEFIELCTLAAVCLARYGNSVLAQVICQGIDPHAFTASMIEGVSLHSFMAWKTSSDPVLKAKFASLRQRAKAVNFGIPSGLTAAGLSLYAKSAYGVELGQEEAEKFRTTLIRDIYPELSKYLQEGDMERLASNLGVSLKRCWSTFTFSKGKGSPSAQTKEGEDSSGKQTAAPRVEAVEGGMRNIVRGKKFRKRDGKEYSPFFVKKIWSGLKRLTRDPRVFNMIHEAEKDNQGSEELFKELFGRPVTTLTGRVRGKVGFTQACNTPFSGLAADGAKLALWNLYLLGYTVVGFIHDEILLEIPETPSGTYDEPAAEIKEVMIQSMRELTGPIPVGVQLSVSKVWSKDAHAVHNERGQLIPWVSNVDPTETA